MIIDLASQISLKNYPRLEKSKTNLNMRNIFWMLTMRQSKIQEPGDCMSREILLPSPETEVFALVLSWEKGWGTLHSQKLS